MNNASIYRVTLVADGRVYIGQTCRKRENAARARWQDHVRFALSGRSRTYFHNAIRKYGPNAFVFEVLEECEKVQANERERHYIAAHRSNDKEFGFNMSEGGDGGQNSMSDEVRLRISEAKRGVSTGPCSPHKAEAIRQTKLSQGRRHSEETRRLISERRNVTELTEEWKAAISAGLRKGAVYKLSPAQVSEILASTESDAALATKYGVSRKMIWRVRNDKLSRSTAQSKQPARHCSQLSD